MALAKYEVEVDPGQALRDAISAAAEESVNLTIPFKLIAQSWFKTNNAIFALKGKGKYDDLSARYKEEKRKAVGFVYPILRRTGRLEESITNPTGTDSINKIVNGRVLILGTKVPYGPPHQTGAPSINLPKRPFVLFGPEQVAPNSINKRTEAWVTLIKEHLVKVLERSGVGTPPEG